MSQRGTAAGDKERSGYREIAVSYTPFINYTFIHKKK